MKKLNTEPQSMMSYKKLFLPAALLLVISGCDRNNDNSGDLLDDSGDNVIVAPPQVSTSGVNVAILDQDRAPVLEASLFVISDSENGDLVPDDSEALIVEDGIARIPLNSFEDAGVIRLEAEKDGFFSNGGRYDLVAGEDLQVEIVLTSETAETEGISIVATEGDLSTGSISATAMSTEDPDEVLTSVMVPQDLEILDVNGDPLNDSLRMSVVHYDSRDENSLAAFPGGFDVVVENIDDVNTPAIEGTIPTEEDEPVDSGVVFKSVGFTAVEIFDSDGNKADTFNGAIDVTMAIPPNTINPQTGELIQLGDIIPVWSFDTDTAKWVYEGNQPTQADGRGGLQVTYQADHLSYWNLDFWSNSTCNGVFDVSVSGSDGQVVPDVPIQITLLGADELGFRRNITSVDSGRITLFNGPATFDVTASFQTNVPGLNILNVSRGGVPYNGGGFRFCDGGNFSVQTDQPSAEIAELSNFSYEVSVVAECTNSPNTQPLPVSNANVYFYSRDYDTYLQGNTNAAGRITLGGSGNSDGRIYANYRDGDGRYNSQSRSVNGDSELVSFTFPTQCTVVTGANGQ